MALLLIFEKKKILKMSAINKLESFINLCSLKQKVIAENIANIGSENYKRKDIDFQDSLNELISKNLKITREKHIGYGNTIGTGKYEIVEKGGIPEASGINDVDIDKEMAELAETSIKFKFAARKIGDYYKNLQRVIKGGGA